MECLAEVRDESIVKGTVHRDGFHAEGVSEERVEKVLENVNGEERVNEINFLVMPAWNIAVGQGEVEQAERHEVHADKIGVATDGGKKLVFGEDEYQVARNRNDERE